jgi:UDP-glucose 4-epimerase
MWAMPMQFATWPCAISMWRAPPRKAGAASRRKTPPICNGFSVLEVIAAVKRASGTDFAVRFGPRRPGDPAALVARAERIGEVLGWHPTHDDLNLS